MLRTMAGTRTRMKGTRKVNDSADEVVRIEPGLSAIDGRAWDACALPDPATANPFVSYAFLKCLEDSGSVGGRTGWTPQHLTITDAGGGLAACLPAYVKTHSQGEYVFDHGWAHAYERAGGRYYPKLQIAVPFTPVPGPRLLVRPGAEAAANEQVLAAAAIELASQAGLSSVHLTFIDGALQDGLGALGFLKRSGQQFHWTNQGYATFDDFLATFASRKRKTVRKEREQAVSAGIEIEHIQGHNITKTH